MIGIAIANSCGLKKPFVASVDPNAQAFITAAGITNPIEQTAINNLVIGLKADNLWNRMYAIYPFVGSTASQQKYNLKDPRDLDAAFRLVFNGGWTHSNTGATPNGTNGYADTNFIQSNIPYPDYEQFHISYYSRTNNTKTALDMGVYNPDPFYEQTYISINYSNSTSYCVNGGSGGLTRTFPTTGFYLATATGVDRNLYRENINIHNYSGPTPVPQTRSIWIGGRNNDGEYTDRECAFSTIGFDLDSTQVSNLYTNVQAFQTALSRNV